jgi:hypothetical protein
MAAEAADVGAAPEFDEFVGALMAEAGFPGGQRDAVRNALLPLCPPEMFGVGGPNAFRWKWAITRYVILRKEIPVLFDGLQEHILNTLETYQRTREVFNNSGGEANVTSADGNKTKTKTVPTQHDGGKSGKEGESWLGELGEQETESVLHMSRVPRRL